MESIRTERRAPAGLPLTAGMLNRRGNVSSEFGNKLGDLVESAFQGIQARPQRTTIDRNGIGCACLMRAAVKYSVKTSGLPAESHRQRLKRPGTAATLNGMPLDFPHDGSRHMRTLRKLPLTPAKLTDTVADNPGDGGPITRHAFRHARSSAFHFQR
jgi:hypothetical protein